MIKIDIAYFPEYMNIGNGIITKRYKEQTIRIFDINGVQIISLFDYIKEPEIVFHALRETFNCAKILYLDRVEPTDKIITPLMFKTKLTREEKKTHDEAIFEYKKITLKYEHYKKIIREYLDTDPDILFKNLDKVKKDLEKIMLWEDM